MTTPSESLEQVIRQIDHEISETISEIQRHEELGRIGQATLKELQTQKQAHMQAAEILRKNL